MEIKEYAPVVITTLNRFEHFRRCLDSLERCTGSDKTDVYVGLDYPPSEKYVEGWKKIDEYLKVKEVNNGFRNLFVRRRDHNCGVSKPGSNGYLLLREIKEITDRYISSEDDNEFSPCFLDFMNKALEKYKDDERVIGVCGYSPIDYEGGENVYFVRRLSTWGLGRWIYKSKESFKYRNLTYLEKVIKDIPSVVKLYKYRPTLLSRVMDQLISGKVYRDELYACYCVLHNRYSIFPSKSLVRNWGNDGSGIHCKNIDDTHFVNRIISQESIFNIDDVEVAERVEIWKMGAKVASKKWYGNIAIILRYLIWRITKVDIFSVRKKKIISSFNR